MQCKQCSKGFKVTDADRKLLDQFSPVFNGKKYAIPEPAHCPDCRQQRRLSICNERFLYPWECDFCHKKTLTQFPPHLRQPAYCRECWHSDKWDARDYGCDFNFSRPFFEQFKELKLSVPAQALNQQGNNVNSEYIHFAGSCKNCYLIMHADFCEDCCYGYGFKKDVYCLDGFYNLHCELCYDCVDIHKCYGLIGCQDCSTCHSCAFLRDCIGCKNCFLCVGLRQKQYCFGNKQLTKEEYAKKMSEIDLGSYEQYQKCRARLSELETEHTFKEYQGYNLHNCSGNYLINGKDLDHCFDCEDVENARYSSQIVLGGKNLMDVYQYGSNLQESYEVTISGENSYHLLFCDDCHVSSSDLIYCWYMEVSKNCFGCTHMNHAQYCILNKQYTRGEYEDLVPRIIEHMRGAGEWGEFFPMTLSPFGYNRSQAQIYYPLEKEQVLARGLAWDDYTPPVTAAKTIPASRLPDNIKETPDDILNWAITCEKTGKAFKITDQELRFYRKQELPIPRRHFNQRHLDRFARRNPRQLFERKCDHCGKGISTTWSPERPEKVYCENCYHKTIY